MDAQVCIKLMVDYLLGEDYYVADPVSEDQANTILTHEILRRHSKRYVKEKKNIIDEEYRLYDKTAFVTFKCDYCGSFTTRPIVLTNEVSRMGLPQIVKILINHYDKGSCSKCSRKGFNKITGVKYKGSYLARVRKKGIKL